MAITSQYSDAVEPIADTDAEAATNQHLYGVIEGCAVTYDAADLTYDVAAGMILHSGKVVSVAAQTNAGTLVPDATNPRWATIYIDSTGTEGLVHGTAAADPSKPETGDNVAIAMVLIEAAQTVANNIATKLDKRVMTHAPATLTKVATATQTFSASTTLVDVISSGTPATMGFAIGASEIWHAKARIRVTYTGTGGIKFQFSGPAAPTAVRITGHRNVVNLEGSTDLVRTFAEPFTVVTAFAADFCAANAAAGTVDLHHTGDNNGFIEIDLIVINGANAGNVVLQSAQNSANGTSVIQIGSWFEAQRIG